MDRDACCLGHSPLRNGGTSDLYGERSPEVWAWNLLSSRGESEHLLLPLLMLTHKTRELPKVYLSCLREASLPAG